jgi:hypothetical protein
VQPLRKNQDSLVEPPLSSSQLTVQQYTDTQKEMYIKELNIEDEPGAR